MLRRDIATNVSEQRNQCRLAHIGAFTAHVRTGNDQHSSLWRQVQRVSDERFVQHLLHHRVAAFGNANARFVDKGRAGVVQRFRTLCQVNQHIQLCQRARAELQVAEMRHEHVEQFVIQLLFQRQRFAFRGENFIFVLFQLRNNVALGVFQRLATYVVDRGQVALPTADLNEVAVYRVIADFQGIEAQAFALADLQLVEIVRCTVSQRAPFVQLLVVARRNDPRRRAPEPAAHR
ncbi:Uncharacterised protein [Enterobacter cancerogenus]|uniref:Uncharacterized protein n=1 Tax=Enterobacter cancerogenus TaxID=69218 RepID=A0A484Z8G1_9ENTR|nr:Uncharacterised protein [Enterobacter cancerogenus]